MRLPPRVGGGAPAEPGSLAACVALQRVWMRSGYLQRQYWALLTVPLGSQLERTAPRAVAADRAPALRSAGARPALPGAAFCLDRCAPATTVYAVAALLGGVEQRIPQVFQLRFFAISRRLRKISKTLQRYRQAYCYVHPARRRGLLGRYLAAFFDFAPPPPGPGSREGAAFAFATRRAYSASSAAVRAPSLRRARHSRSRIAPRFAR